MPLLTKAQTALAAIQAATAEFENRLASCATVGNRMVQILLDLSDADLSEALNLLGNPVERFASHGASGEAVNTAIRIAAATLDKQPQALVDVRSFADKLADQRRTIAFDGATWTVSTLPLPQPPAPEPITEPIAEE